MVTPKNPNDRVAEDFLRSLEATTELVQSLVQDIREGEIDFSAIKTELRILVENVKHLSEIVRENEDGLYTLKIKIALLEKSVTEIEEWLKEKKHKDESDSSSLKVADKTGKWQAITAVAAGAIALITAVVTLIVNLIAK